MLNLAKLWERTFTKSWEKHIPGGYLTLSTRGGYAALSIAGNLDATNAPMVEAELEAILATEPDLLVFDLAELGACAEFLPLFHRVLGLFNEARDEVRQPRAVDDWHALGH